MKLNICKIVVKGLLEEISGVADVSSTRCVADLPSFQIRIKRMFKFTSMGSTLYHPRTTEQCGIDLMGLAKPIDFQRRVVEPTNFFGTRVR